MATETPVLTGLEPRGRSLPWEASARGKCARGPLPNALSDAEAAMES
jgi:hypothetical protein